MAANLDAVFLSTRAALGLMGPGGRVVLVSSTAGQRGEAFHADYAATKGAVIALTKSLAIECAPDILVNCVAPGWVDTEMCETRVRRRRTRARSADDPARPDPAAGRHRGPDRLSLQRSRATRHRRGAEREWGECAMRVRRSSMIHLLFTGGTISMQRDRGGGRQRADPRRRGARGLRAGASSAIAPYRIEDWARLPACHLGPDRLWALRERVREVAESGEVAGIVITHGTDTIEETAYLLDRTLDPAIPVAITGAMRTSSDTEWDGPRNLIDAAAVAASDDERRPRGDGGVQPARSSRVAPRSRCTRPDVDAFAAPHAGRSAAWTGAGSVNTECPRRRDPHRDPVGLTARVAQVPMVVGDEGALLDLARPSHDGVVIERVRQRKHSARRGARHRAVARRRQAGGAGHAGVPTARSRRSTRSTAAARALVAMGVVPAGPRTPSQARMELTIALSAGVPYGAP